MERVRRLPASDRTWHIFVAVVLVGALVARILAIVVDRQGGDDLQIYVYFARFVLEGGNPYTAPEQGPIAPSYGDNSVGELGLFAAVLSLHDSQTTLRGFFVLADLATLSLLAFGYMRSRWWKAQLMVFYAFNPLILDQWSVNGDDKTVLFCLVVALLVSLERGSIVSAWIVTTGLGVLKWLSAYFLLPLVLFTSRSMGTLRTVALLLASLLVVGLTMIPYFPDSLDPIARRRERLSLDPGHASFTKLLDQVGLYHPLMVNVLMTASILAVILLFVSSRIDLREVVVLSIAAAFLFLPDQGVNRLVFIATPFLLIMRLSARRLIAIWLASFVSLIAAVVTSGRFESAARSGDIPLGTSLTDLIGPFGSTQFVVLANVYLVVVVGIFAFDRLRGRVDDERLSRELRLH